MLNELNLPEQEKPVLFNRPCNEEASAAARGLCSEMSSLCFFVSLLDTWICSPFRIRRNQLELICLICFTGLTALLNIMYQNGILSFSTLLSTLLIYFIVEPFLRACNEKNLNFHMISWHRV